MKHLAEVLFTVFVSIEATGESVEFEQKLSYRQPMYKIIDYIWKLDVHRAAVEVSIRTLKAVNKTHIIYTYIYNTQYIYISNIVYVVKLATRCW